MSGQKTNLTILIMGAVGTLLLVLMYMYAAESDPAIGDRMRVARLARQLFRLDSAVLSCPDGTPERTLLLSCVFGSNTILKWDESGLADAARFVDVNYPGDRQGISGISVHFRRETGSGCGRTVDEIDLARPLPLSPAKKK